jgi:hypothetical protein
MVEGMRYSNLLTAFLLLKKFRNSGILGFWDSGIEELKTSHCNSLPPQFQNPSIPQFAIAFFPV